MIEPKDVGPGAVERPRRLSHFRREESFHLPPDWEEQRAKFEAFDAQHRKAVLRKVAPSSKPVPSPTDNPPPRWTSA